MRYLVAWSLFGCVLYGGYVGYSHFQNPWSVHRVSVLDVLPPPGAGCNKDCTK